METNKSVHNYRFVPEMAEWSHSRIIVNLHKKIGINAKQKSSRNSKVPTCVNIKLIYYIFTFYISREGIYILEFHSVMDKFSV
jgi:hypothetical protein